MHYISFFCLSFVIGVTLVLIGYLIYRIGVMLGIKRTVYHSPFYWWTTSWFCILDNLLGILTLAFLYSNLAEWWGDLIVRKTRIRKLSIKVEIPFSFGGRVRWWFGDWVGIFQSLFTILTLGYSCMDWTAWFYAPDEICPEPSWQYCETCNRKFNCEEKR